MAEIGGDHGGRPVETLVTELSDAPVPSEADGSVPEAPPVVDNEQLYHSIKRMRIMAAELNVRAALSGDGLYAQWAHAAFVSAGLMRQLLIERGSRYAAVLDEETSTEPNSAGTRQLPLR